MKSITAIILSASLAMPLAVSTAAPASAGWKKFWKNVKHGNNAFKKSWNNSEFGKGINSIGNGNCWKEAATVGFTAGIKGNDTC